MAHELRQILSPARTKSLESAGILTVFELLTLFPRKIEQLLPLPPNLRATLEGETYFLEGTLTRTETRRGKRPFLVLHLQTASGNFTGYYFVTARYAYAKLKPNTRLQALVVRKDNLWTVKKIENYKASPEQDHFILGRADPEKPYFQPVYPKTGKLTSGYLLAVHRQIPKALYRLDLTGMIPPNTLIPNQIDLHAIHHPTDLDSYIDAKEQWTAFNLFLKMSVLKYAQTAKQQSQTRAGRLDLEFLRELAGALPYTLSSSQKQTIWSILQEITATSFT